MNDKHSKNEARVKDGISSSLNGNNVPGVDQRVILLMAIYQKSTKLFIDQYKEEEKEYYRLKQIYEEHLRKTGFNLLNKLTLPDYQALSALQRPFLAKWIDGVNKIRAKEPRFPYNEG